MTASAPGVVAVVGAAGGAGGSLVAAGLALVASEGRPGVVLVDLDPTDGGHAAMFATARRRGVDDLVAVGADLTAAHVRAAAYPHPSGAAVVAAGSPGDPAAVAGLARRLAALPDAPDMILDLGSGAAAARAVPPGATAIVIVPRDVAGVRTASSAVAALPPDGTALVLTNAGGRRADLSPRAAGRAVGRRFSGELPRSDREAMRLGVGIVPEGRRRPLTDSLMRLAAGLFPVSS